MLPALIVTKYLPPPAGAGQVARDQIVELLLAGLDRKCTLISAPPGFGKTSLAAELVRRSGRPTAWLSLDRGDSDPARFGGYLVEAIWASRCCRIRSSARAAGSSWSFRPVAAPP